MVKRVAWKKQCSPRCRAMAAHWRRCGREVPKAKPGVCVVCGTKFRIKAFCGYYCNAMAAHYRRQAKFGGLDLTHLIRNRGLNRCMLCGGPVIRGAVTDKGGPRPSELRSTRAHATSKPR